MLLFLTQLVAQVQMAYQLGCGAGRGKLTMSPIGGLGLGNGESRPMPDPWSFYSNYSSSGDDSDDVCWTAIGNALLECGKDVQKELTQDEPRVEQKCEGEKKKEEEDNEKNGKHRKHITVS